MKRIISIVLVLVMCLTIVGCQVNNSGVNDETSKDEPANNDKVDSGSSSADKGLSPEDVYSESIDAVFDISTFDKDGDAIASGTGFFVSKDGKFYTNYHVIEDAYSIILTDNRNQACQSKDITILGYDKDKDVAILKANNFTVNKYLELERKCPAIGETIYTIGNSLGLSGTFSDGMVSAVDRKVGDVNCIQISAPISHGNSGGPLLNKYGKVLGVNSASLADGQNLNFAIDINVFDTVGQINNYSTAEFYKATTFFDIDLNEIKHYETGNNSTITTADVVERGTTIVGSMGNWDMDYYKFNVPSGKKIVASLTATEYTSYYCVGIVDENDRFVAAGKYISSSNMWLLDYEVPASGTYGICVFLDADYNYTASSMYTIYTIWNDSYKL